MLACVCGNKGLGDKLLVQGIRMLDFCLYLFQDVILGKWAFVVTYYKLPIKVMEVWVKKKFQDWNWGYSNLILGMVINMSLADGLFPPPPPPPRTHLHYTCWHPAPLNGTQKVIQRKKNGGACTKASFKECAKFSFNSLRGIPVRTENDDLTNGRTDNIHDYIYLPLFKWVHNNYG